MLGAFCFEANYDQPFQTMALKWPQILWCDWLSIHSPALGSQEEFEGTTCPELLHIFGITAITALSSNLMKLHQINLELYKHWPYSALLRGDKSNGRKCDADDNPAGRTDPTDPLYSLHWWLSLRMTKFLNWPQRCVQLWQKMSPHVCYCELTTGKIKILWRVLIATINPNTIGLPKPCSHYADKRRLHLTREVICLGRMNVTHPTLFESVRWDAWMSKDCRCGIWTWLKAIQLTLGWLIVINIWPISQRHLTQTKYCIPESPPKHPIDSWTWTNWLKHNLFCFFADLPWNWSDNFGSAAMLLRPLDYACLNEKKLKLNSDHTANDGSSYIWATLDPWIEGGQLPPELNWTKMNQTCPGRILLKVQSANLRRVAPEKWSELDLLRSSGTIPSNSKLWSGLIPTMALIFSMVKPLERLWEKKLLTSAAYISLTGLSELYSMTHLCNTMRNLWP